MVDEKYRRHTDLFKVETRNEVVYRVHIPSPLASTPQYVVVKKAVDNADVGEYEGASFITKITNLIRRFLRRILHH